MKKLDSKTLNELLDLAREWGLSGYSKLKKSELLRLLARKIPALSPKKPNGRAAAKKEPPSANAARKEAARARAARPPASRDRKPAPTTTKATAPGQTGRASRSLASATELPAAYQDGRMTLLTRDPFWLYCYWDLTEEQQNQLWEGQSPTLRLLEEESSGGQKEVKRIPLSRGARSWYIQVDDADKAYRAELGRVDPKGHFVPVIGSNQAPTARGGVSGNLDAFFGAAPAPAGMGAGASSRAAGQAVSEQQADRFYALSAGVRRGGISSAEALGALRRRLESGLASEQLHSGALAPVSGRGISPAPSPGYWLIVDADLIVYGATVPGSKVTIQNIPVVLDEHGRFWARFALPDGSLTLPIKGVSPDQRHHKAAHIQVRRDTRQEA